MSLWLERLNELERYHSMVREAKQHLLLRQSQSEKVTYSALDSTVRSFRTCLASWKNRFSGRHGTAGVSTAPAGKRSII